MRGVISGIVPDGTYGQVLADDGKHYSYWTSEVRNGPVKVGQTVEFQMWEGQPVDIHRVDQMSPPRAAPPQRQAAQPSRGGGPTGPGAYAMATAGGGAAYATPTAAAAAFPTGRDYWIKLFTSPSGRISRRQFWLHGVLVIVACNILLTWIPIIGQLLALVLLWGSICIAFKRFHDLDYPGWYSLLYLVPLVAAVVVFSIGLMVVRFLDLAWLLTEILGGISLLIGLAQVFFVYIRPGQQGPNQYGPDPLADA